MDPARSVKRNAIEREALFPLPFKGGGGGGINTEADEVVQTNSDTEVHHTPRSPLLKERGSGATGCGAFETAAFQDLVGQACSRQALHSGVNELLNCSADIKTIAETLGSLAVSFSLTHRA